MREALLGFPLLGVASSHDVDRLGSRGEVKGLCPDPFYPIFPTSSCPVFHISSSRVLFSISKAIIRGPMPARRKFGSGDGRKGLLLVASSYVTDWVLLAAGAAVGYVLGELTPNKRPFSPDDRSIAYVTCRAPLFC